MRVVHLTSVHPTFDVRIFRKECSTLAAAGYETTLIAPHHQREHVGGVSIRPVPKMISRIARMTITPWRVYREAILQHADVYHFHDPELIPVGLLLRAHGKRVIYDMHEDVPQDILGKDYLPRLLRRPLAIALDCIERISSRFFSGLIAATPAIARRFGRSDSKTEVVQNFPSHEDYDFTAVPKWDEREMSVIYAGSITRGRGIYEMIQAVSLVASELQVKLRIAGTFSPSELRLNVQALPGWERVRDAGLLPPPRLRELLGKVRAGLLVFHPDPNNIQAQPNKLFEYMAAGIPVVASDFPLWREIVNGAGCGLLVDPLKPNEIAKAIEYLLTHSNEAEAMGIRGRQAVYERYHWDTEKTKLLRLYERLREPVCVA